MEVSGKRQQEDGTGQRKGILCDLCNEENEEEPAVSFCTVCNEYLCEADTKAHRKAKVLKDHVLLDGDEMPHQKLKALEDNTFFTHSRKQIEYYCLDHSKWCCTLCATVEHKECDIAYIDDIAKGYELGEEYPSLVKSIDDQTKCLENTQKEAAKKKEYVKLNLEKLISEVKKFRVELNAALDFLESATLKEIQLLSDFDIQLSDSVSTQCETILSDIQDISSKVEYRKKYKQRRQLVIQSKEALTQIGEYERKIAELLHQNTFQMYTFSPDDEILQSLKKLNTFGHFPGMKYRYSPKGIDQETNEELSAHCGQSDIGLTVADQDEENKGTMNAERDFEINKTSVADFCHETKATKKVGRNLETVGTADLVRDLEVKKQNGSDKGLDVKNQIDAENPSMATEVNRFVPRNITDEYLLSPIIKRRAKPKVNKRIYLVHRD